MMELATFGTHQYDRETVLLISGLQKNKYLTF